MSKRKKKGTYQPVEKKPKSVLEGIMSSGTGLGLSFLDTQQGSEIERAKTLLWCKGGATAEKEVHSVVFAARS